MIRQILIEGGGCGGGCGFSGVGAGGVGGNNHHEKCADTQLSRGFSLSLLILLALWIMLVFGLAIGIPFIEKIGSWIFYSLF